MIERVQPAALLPDTHAHFLGENPQHVLHGALRLPRAVGGADAEPFTLTDELFDGYLEPCHE